MPDLSYILFIPLLPLAAFLLLGIGGKNRFRKTGPLIATLGSLVAFLLALYTAYSYFFEYGKVSGIYQQVPALQYAWLKFTSLRAIEIGIQVDPITAMMLLVITFISLMVHIYSLGYMKGDARLPVYYAFLGLFTFSMLGLVVAYNIFQVYIFWELVGVSSFLLIGYHYTRATAVAAAKKAFIVTRFADLGFLAGILLLSKYGLNFRDLLTGVEGLGQPVANFAEQPAFCFGLLLVFVGAAGKSAMFPLHIWLPDAMEGPTPVSALIHAATMVVAGVFLVARMFPLFSLAPQVLAIVAYTGAFSAVFAAVIACTQTDIKRVLAYSTMSQIGFMMFALGVSGYGGEKGLGFMAAMFHLFTHAIFKALLFLGAGVIIHAVHSNEMKDMGGLRKTLPITHICFLIACLAIAGIPPFAGFFSKEEMLLAAWQNNRLVYWIALCTSGVTAFYMFRLYFRIFWNNGPQHAAPQGEGGATMLLPLVLLAAGAAVAGFIPFGNFVSSDRLALHTHIDPVFSLAPVALAVTGILAAMLLYKKESALPKKMAAAAGGFYKAACQKFYVDEVYLFITKKIIFNLIAKPAAWIDRALINGAVNATGNITQRFSAKIKGFQSGKVQQYAIYYLAGVIGLAVFFIYLWK